MARAFGSAVDSSCSTISPIRWIRFWNALSCAIVSFKDKSKRLATDAADYPAPKPACFLAATRFDIRTWIVKRAGQTSGE